jgi:hypothetical protein
VLLVDILAKVTEHSTLRACSLIEPTAHYTEVCIFRGYVFQLCLFMCLHECLYLFNFSLGFEVIDVTCVKIAALLMLSVYNTCNVCSPSG